MERSKSRQILFPVILIVIFILLIEGLLSMYFYQQNGAERLASIETLRSIKSFISPRKFDLNVTNHNLVRPDSTEDVNHAIAQEVVESNRFVYESWVEFRNMDYDGKYMDMQQGIRETVPSEYYPANNGDTVDIYFMGGSTMFGFNVLDHETIPSQFMQLYKEKHPQGKPVRVTNFGTPTYYSYQELILLSDLIFQNKKPDMVIFLDGINDFWFVKSSYHRQTYFSYIFRQAFNRGLRTKGEFQFIDSADNMFKDPAGIETDQYYNTIIRNYTENMVNAQKMAGMIGAKTYFFCQPSPFYEYPNQQKDPMCFKDTNTRFNYIYPVLEKKAPDLPNFTFLGNMLKDETGYPFVDGLHYSPAFIRKISEQILSTVEQDLIAGPEKDPVLKQ